MLPAKRINGQNWLPDFFTDFLEGSALTRFGGSSPAMNVIEDDKSYNIELAAPGMCKKEGKYLRKEFSYSKFHQTLALPENADRDNIGAEVKNGILYVNIPKLQNMKEENQKRIVEVK